MSMHQMNHTATDADGRQRWECPTCDRAIIMTWPKRDKDGNQIQEPGYYPIETLVRGDESAQHTGAIGPVSMSAVEVSGL
jgi:hypothetical protein